VSIFDHVDALVPMSAKMHQKRLRGDAAIGDSVNKHTGVRRSFLAPTKTSAGSSVKRPPA